MSIWRNKAALGYTALGIGLTLGAAATMEWASAQTTKKAVGIQVARQEPQPPGDPGQPPFPGGGPGGQGFPGGPGSGAPGYPGAGQGFRGMGMGMMGGGPATVTATEKYVYVLRGDTLYQYSVDGLKLTAKATLPRPEPPQRPGGPPNDR